MHNKTKPPTSNEVELLDAAAEVLELETMQRVANAIGFLRGYGAQLPGDAHEELNGCLDRARELLGFGCCTDSGPKEAA